jgi:putative Mn2+ efflux pump MntP
MLNQSVGEWILSAVTTPDRAASIVGDLIQSRASSIRFWTAISSNVLHAITPRLGVAIVAFLAQFIVFLIPSIAITYCLRSSVLSIYQWHSCAVLSFLGTQMLTGFWIGRASQRLPLLVSLLVVVFDCALGVLNVNTVSINMAIWSVPLFLGTIAAHRRHRRSV